MKILFGRCRYKLGHKIRMVLRKIGFYDVEWIRMFQDGDQWQVLVRMAINL
jgi:hypothetical protein